MIRSPQRPSGVLWTRRNKRPLWKVQFYHTGSVQMARCLLERPPELNFYVTVSRLWSSFQEFGCTFIKASHHVMTTAAQDRHVQFLPLQDDLRPATRTADSTTSSPENCQKASQGSSWLRLLGLLWSSAGSHEVLGCVQAHCPAAVNNLLTRGQWYSHLIVYCPHTYTYMHNTRTLNLNQLNGVQPSLSWWLAFPA